MQADRITAESPGSNVFLKDGAPVKPKIKQPLPELFPPTSLGNVRPTQRAFGASGAFKKRSDPATLESIVPLAQRVIENFTEAPKTQTRLIPAGQDVYGQQRFRMANADHRYADKWDTRMATSPDIGPSHERVGSAAEWTPPLSILSDGSQGAQMERELPRLKATQPALPLMPGEDQATHDLKNSEQQLITAATVLKDANYLIANPRRNSFDSPYSKDDDPVTKYELPNGVKFEVDPNRPDKDPRIAYLRLKNGYIVPEDELITPEGKSAVVPAAVQLPGGRVIDGSAFDAPQMQVVDKENPASWVIIKDPNDPRMQYTAEAADGTRYYAKNIMLANGEIVSQDDLRFNAKTSHVKLKDGRVIPVGDLPQSSDELKQAFYQYRAPDRETVLMNADGTVPPDLQRYMDQKPRPENNIADVATNFFRWNVSNPRGPWQDEAGNNAWEFGKYDIRHSTADEIAPWFVDTNLSSVPYYMPKPYSYPSALAESLPYAYGVDGDTYLPMQGGVANVGRGTYAGNQITNSQAIGGMLSGPVDAWAERFGKRVIGGLAEMPGPKQVLPPLKRAAQKVMPSSVMAAGKKFAGSRIGQMAEAGTGEGYEELWSGPFSEMEITGAKNYGYPKYMNEKTNEWEFDTTKPGGLFSPSAASSQAQNWLSGFALGAPIQGILSRRKGSRGQTDPRIPDAMPTMPTGPELPNLAPGQSTLDRRYEKVKW